MNQIILNDILIEKNNIIYKYSAYGEIKKYVSNKECFIEYSEDISSVKKSIAIIPFVCNILPVVWILDAELIIEELDKHFYECISDIKEGYRRMHPKIEFKGKIRVNKIIDNNYESTNKVASFFSGGVDAFSTLISHIDENPIIISIWGADIKLDDERGGKALESHLIETKKLLNIDGVLVRTSLKEFLDFKALERLIYNKIGIYRSWWHDYQHGIGIIGHSAPLIYKYKLKCVYIASSYSTKKGFERNEPCASDYTIDNFVKMASCSVIHDGLEYNRQDKIHNIVTFCQNKRKYVKLRVCWESRGGNNCCKCEKCYRTIYGIIAEKLDPKLFGFYDVNIKRMNIELKYKLNNLVNRDWQSIQDKMKKYSLTEKERKQYKWICTENFKTVNINRKKRLINILRRIKRLIS